MSAADAGCLISWHCYQAICLVCESGSEALGGMSRGDAEKQIREDGWSKRKGKWWCPACLEASSSDVIRSKR